MVINPILNLTAIDSILLVDVALTLNRIPFGNSLVAEKSITSIGGLVALMEVVGRISNKPKTKINIDTDEIFLIQVGIIFCHGN